MHDPRRRLRLLMVALLLTGATTAAARGHGSPLRGPLPDEQRDLIHLMAQKHEGIDRTVEITDAGYVATTTSDDPQLASALLDHVHYMEKRLDSGAMVRRWDPAFGELVEHYDDLEVTVEELENGLRVRVEGTTEQAVAVAHNHARIVSGFVEEGAVAVQRTHPVAIEVEAEAP